MINVNTKLLSWALLIFWTLVALFPNQVRASNKVGDFQQLLENSQVSKKTTELFQRAAVMVLSEFIDRHHITNANGINLINLRNQILSQVSWTILKGMKISAGANGTRSTATYSVELKTVIVDLHEWNNASPWSRPLIALHEALGALGYPDDDYEISLALNISLSMLPENSERIREQWVSAAIENELDPSLIEFISSADWKLVGQEFTGVPPLEILLAKGGVTGGSRGGDQFTAILKLGLVLTSSLFWRVLNTQEASYKLGQGYAQMILNCKIEKEERAFVFDHNQSLVDISSKFMDQLKLRKVSQSNCEIEIPNSPELLKLIGSDGEMINKLIGLVHKKFITEFLRENGGSH